MNYLQVMVRVLVRNKLFTSLNLIGLSMGIASSLLILLWVFDELSIDSFHDENVYQIVKNSYFTNGEIQTSTSTPGPLVPALKSKYPEIEFATRIQSGGHVLIKSGEKGFIEVGKYVDPDFFNVFNFPLVAGDIKKIFLTPEEIVITEKTAIKLFSSHDVVGKTLFVDGVGEHVIAGVVRDIPHNSTLKFDFLLPIAPYEKTRDWFRNWGNQSPLSYVKIKKDANIELLNEKIRDEQKSGNNDNTIKYTTQAFSDRYLYAEYKNGLPTGNGRIQYVRLFTTVAAFILIIACINFMNLTTAQSSRRAKEVGVRKVVGAIRAQLVNQFLRESVFFTILCSTIAVFIVTLALPLFNFVTEKQISFTSLSARTALVIFILILATGFVAGSYPAFYLSNLKPITILKGIFRTGRSGSSFRRVLVIAQFALSIGVIVCTLVVSRQMNFIRDQQSGIDRTGLLYVPLRGDFQKHYKDMKLELSKESFIKGVAGGSRSPNTIDNWTTAMEWPHKTDEELLKFMTSWADEDFCPTVGFEIINGRNFLPENLADSTNIIINETAARAMNLENPIGQPVTWWGSRKGTIIGVVKDFNYQSMHNEVEPLILLPVFNRTWAVNTLIVKTNYNTIPQTLETLEQLQKKFAPDYPFEYKFADDEWAELHKSEEKFAALFIFFATLSVVISCLGLFGLVAFSAEQRKKEIGIRKVLGATVGQLTVMLSKDFSKLILFGAIPGCAIAAYYMRNWLSTFAYRVDMGYFTFIYAVSIAFLIALLTMSFQAIKAAMENPIASLKQE